jgi:hypothetical protein
MSQLHPTMRLLTLGSLVACIASTASAQHSGLLLGLSSDSGYRTLWIAPSAGKLAVAARPRGLIVPRADGFHHLDIVRWCSMDRESVMPNGPFYDTEDILVDLPVGRPPVQPDSTHVDCGAADSIVSVAHDSLDKASEQALATARTREDSSAVERSDPDSYQCYSRELLVTHAGPHYVSVYYHEGAGENCEAGRETWRAQRSTTRDGQGVDLMPLLTKGQARRILTTWEKEKGDCALEQSPSDSWGIVRALGRWEFAFSTSGATVCAGRSGNEEEGFSIRQAVPESVARREPVGRWLPKATVLFTTVDDIFVSPANDLLVVLSGGRLSAFELSDGALGSVRLELDLRAGEQVVMAEWATGTHVDRWTRQLAALHERW